MNKVILVSGTNRGIGNEITKQLLKEGHTVIAGMRNTAYSKKAFEGINDRLFPVKLDVTNSEDIRVLSVFIQDKFNKLDVLINNAGVMNHISTIEETKAEAFRVFDTNFFGLWELSNTMLPLLRNADEGRIVNISSGLGARNDMVGGYASYRLSKYALNGLTLQMHNELVHSNIKVNSMCPGWVQTDMGGDNAPRSIQQGAETAVWLATESKIESGKFFRDKTEIPW
jgi:NAD(P)-dependent dehydrogenase (short-subunit alcohol dehydrogenase family)